VRALKTRLGPFVAALDASVARCAKIEAATRDAWKAFVASWRAYESQEEHFLTAGAEFNAGCDYEASIARWQTLIGGFACSVPGPTLPEPAPRGADTSTASTVRTVAIAAGVVAVALAARSLAR
jgi:hypothetical protein